MNNEKKYGVVTKLLHWSIFVLFILQFFLVYRREYFPKDSPEKMQYMLLHKSFGATILALAIFMIIWRHLGKRPSHPSHMPKTQSILAKVVHALLYLCMLIMPLSGISMSQLSGYKVSIFNWFDLPMLVSVNKDLAGVFHEIHEYTSFAIIALVSGHALAALYHHFVNKDNVLEKITFGQVTKSTT